MVKRMVAAVVTVCAGISLGVLLAVAGHSGTAVAAPTPAVPQSSSAQVVGSGQEIPVQDDATAGETQQEGYYIKDYRGRVAVLKGGSDVPEMIFDIYTKMLPELDRQQLAAGIFVQSYEEMLRQVEDYIS